MSKTKTAKDDKSQRQKFIEAAQEHGATDDEKAFDRAIESVGKARPPKPGSPSKKTKS